MKGIVSKKGEQIIPKQISFYSIEKRTKRAVEIASVYFLLLLVGFVFVYPIIYMVSYSLMDTSDLVNPLVKWIPTKLYTGNYKDAVKVLDYAKTLTQTIIISTIPALLQTISASVVGYGFSRFNFPGKNIMFAAAVATFILPPQVTMIPQFLMFKDLNLLGTLWSLILPATFTQGIRSAIFIIIFYQFFNMFPKSLEEAAKIDGASTLTIFYRIVAPSALPAYLISFLFSLVWYWNDTVITALYLGEKWTTLPLQLQRFEDMFRRVYQSIPGVTTGRTLNEAIVMAGTLLTILPLLLIYFFAQDWFVESIDRTGITGE
ncbi:multiple sugar transport system permease protein [Fervidobacterium changbaicum]|uniref:Carbohydrate ABC transporter permease n=1 Tax=Fervidobacterium changbaicum TaxID=310769 RepID=A0ABX5QQ82_9BACT|nr:carbohydrate ABC transporter permease [Fervidobacterium changbaicum]QAV32642.1 carbohydrate ABC transporter permease [Fervidobacterium changbaicum]SDH36082.1 multiple sugar transport system permease protein [Fervidobacterium changbaicum]